MKIYISGPMTGLPDLNRPAFNDAAAQLRAQGHEVVNPAELPEIPGGTWVDCMKRDIPLLLECEAVHLLEGWRHSRSANLEYQVAFRLGFWIQGACE